MNKNYLVFVFYLFTITLSKSERADSVTEKTNEKRVAVCCIDFIVNEIQIDTKGKIESRVIRKKVLDLAEEIYLRDGYIYILNKKKPREVNKDGLLLNYDSVSITSELYLMTKKAFGKSNKINKTEKTKKGQMRR